ncbi:SpoIID/LytB domain-containing protein [Nocardia caishijiensis]|uniref:SpoIID/LytB domain protein n=1 Tax=Nocardia caishijiensis TaxID=184756 RepID=A0ABQ6YV40_9NOCA|nr:SpoIID/LytB domain-containing protein [Nocardia caishijiensis]KAF0849654.1 SpoIID/LytB domain protein [Nocardia caishijiensis]
MRADTSITRKTRRGTRRRAVPMLAAPPLPVLVGGTALVLAGALGLWQLMPGEVAPTVGAGHGRGMSQVGAFDNARAGWHAEEILGHYYPGAELGQIGATTIGVRLQAQDDATLDTYAAAGAQVAGRMIGPGEAAHLTPLPDGGASVVVTAGCDGEVLWQAATDDPYVYPIGAGPGRPADEHLVLCGGTGYRGALGVALENGSYRTVNQVDIEDYLAGVVPAEMQANWADQGAFEALRAQAIAARSYALAEDRYPYAQTCDTTDCQVYPGTVKEDARTTDAVAATAGTVLLRDGLILRSEYSAAPDGGRPADIETFAVGPAPDDLIESLPIPALPELPADPVPTIEALAGESVIDTEYRRLGGPGSSIGAPIGPEMMLPQRAGTYRLYTNGVIVATKTLGAQVVDFSTLLQLVPEVGEQLPGSAGTGPKAGGTQTDTPVEGAPRLPNLADVGPAPDPGPNPATDPNGGVDPNAAAPPAGSVPESTGSDPAPNAATDPSGGSAPAPSGADPAPGAEASSGVDPNLAPEDVIEPDPGAVPPPLRANAVPTE